MSAERLSEAAVRLGQRVECDPSSTFAGEWTALAAWLRDESERMVEYTIPETDDEDGHAWLSCEMCAKNVGEDCDCWTEPLAVADAILKAA